MTKLSSEHKELEERLQEERTQKEQFKNMKNDIEDERRLLDRTVEKLQREVSALESVVQQHSSQQTPREWRWSQMADFILVKRFHPLVFESDESLMNQISFSKELSCSRLLISYLNNALAQCSLTSHAVSPCS